MVGRWEVYTYVTFAVRDAFGEDFSVFLGTHHTHQILIITNSLTLSPSDPSLLPLPAL